MSSGGKGRRKEQQWYLKDYCVPEAVLGTIH